MVWFDKWLQQNINCLFVIVSVNDDDFDKIELTEKPLHYLQINNINYENNNNFPWPRNDCRFELTFLRSRCYPVLGCAIELGSWVRKMEKRKNAVDNLEPDLCRLRVDKIPFRTFLSHIAYFTNALKFRVHPRSAQLYQSKWIYENPSLFLEKIYSILFHNKSWKFRCFAIFQSNIIFAIQFSWLILTLV